jgi:hypothetical protein
MSARSRLHVVSTLALMTAFCSPVPAEEFELEPGFVSMFNGKDLSWWQFSGKSWGLPPESPGNGWSVADGVIKLAAKSRGNLGSQWSYVDFDMRFEWRATREKYNSGFYIRSNRKVGNNQINLAKGSEGRFFGGKMNGGKPVPELQNPSFEWNEWRVRVEGDKVTFTCNGKEAWKGSDFASKSGHIGFQAEGAPLEFRRVRIKELGVNTLNDLKQWEPAKGWKPAGDGIMAVTGAEDLVTKGQKYKYFLLQLEWKSDDNGNFRATAGDSTGGTTRTFRMNHPDSLNPAGQWNYLEWRVTKDATVATQNGQVQEFQGKPAIGPITIHPHAKSISFRNIRIRHLEDE